MMRTDMSHQKFSIVPPPQDRPMPTLWTERDRGIAECGLDSETAVTLNCVVRGVFEAATNWDGLVADLADTGFGLRFEGDRLILVNLQTGVGLCTCAYLGHSFLSLTDRFGKPNVMAATGYVVSRGR